MGGVETGKHNMVSSHSLSHPLTHTHTHTHTPLGFVPHFTLSQKVGIVEGQNCQGADKCIDTTFTIFYSQAYYIPEELDEQQHC